MTHSEDDINQSVMAIARWSDPTSQRYGRLLNWQNSPDPFWHYGIGLSDTHIFDTGQGLQAFKRRHANAVLGIDDIAFTPEQTIQRLQHAIRVFGEWDYTFTGWNCEHLGRLVATDQPRCYQSQFLWFACDMTPQGDHKTAHKVLRDHLENVDPSLNR